MTYVILNNKKMGISKKIFRNLVLVLINKEKGLNLA